MLKVKSRSEKQSVAGIEYHHAKIESAAPVPSGIEKAWNYVRKNRSKFISELKEVASQPSISAQNIGLKECAELVKSKLSSLGFATKLMRVPGAPDIVYGEINGERKAKTLVIYNHYDVQPVEPLNEWKSEPFEPVIKDGMIYGRGVGDDKGEIVARLNALESIMNSGETSLPRIKWLIEGEEEIGSPHLPNFVLRNKDLLKGVGCLWEGGDSSSTGRPEVHLGVKGLVYIELCAKFGQKDQHSQYGFIAPNPAWRLVNLLKTIKDENGRILIDGFYDDVARPTRQEKKYLTSNEFSAKRLRKDLQIEYLFEGKNDVQTITKHLYSPSANIAGFGSGYLGQGAKTIIPKEAFVKMDFRLVANMKADDILRKIRRHLKANGFDDIKLTVKSKEDPAKTPVESHIAQTLVKSAEMIYGTSPNVWPTIAGTGPLSLFTKILSLPTTMGAGVSYPGASFHAPNEHIFLDHYEKGIMQLVCLLNMF